jgi:hypothetical protein
LLKLQIMEMEKRMEMVMEIIKMVRMKFHKIFKTLQYKIKQLLRVEINIIKHVLTSMILKQIQNIKLLSDHILKAFNSIVNTILLVCHHGAGSIHIIIHQC